MFGNVLAVLRGSSCTLAAKIFEYNYEVAHLSSKSLPSSSFSAVETDQQPDLKTYLKEYERLRWLPTTSLTVKAAILGERPIYPSLELEMLRHYSALNALFSYLFLHFNQGIWKLDLRYWVGLGEYLCHFAYMQLLHRATMVDPS